MLYKIVCGTALPRRIQRKIVCYIETFADTSSSADTHTQPTSSQTDMGVSRGDHGELMPLLDFENDDVICCFPCKK